MVRLTLEQGSSGWTMAAVAAAAVVLAAIFYRRALGRLLPSRWRLLYGLRAVTIVLVVLLLFRPVLSLERDVSRRRDLVLLIDNSASMSTADDATGSTRFERARARALDWSARLKRDFAVHLLAFSERATALDQPGALAHLEPTGASTSLTRALAAAAHAAPRRDIEAIVVLSDGIHNAGGDPVTAARKLGLVVDAVGVGNSLRNSPSYRDVRVADLECPEQTPVNNIARITAHVAQSGLAGQVVQAILEDNGKAADQAELVLKDSAGLQEVSFQIVPTIKGRHTYTIRIPEVPEEKIRQNNQRSAIVQVVDSRIRVLYLEGTLRAEYGALVQRFFSKDPDLEFCALVQTQPNVFLQRTNMPGRALTGLPTDAATLEKFDVILLGDLDSTAWKPGALDLVVKRVRDGAGLLALGGYHSLGPGGYGETPLQAILPVVAGGRDIGQLTDPFVPVLTPAGRDHPIFSNIGKFFPTRSAPPQVGGLPPLDGCVRVKATRPGALALAVHPGQDGEMPVLAVGPAGKGRTAVFTGDTTRNWQQVPRALDQESPFLRFWGQVIRWLANRADDMKVQGGIVVRTDRAYYEPDATITVQAAIRDKEGEGSDQAQVVAQVVTPDGTDESVALSPIAGSAGNYEATFEPRRPGTYEIAVRARLGASLLRAEPVSAEVGKPNLEFDRLDLDDTLLTRIATATGGRYYHLSTADELLGELDRRERRRHVSLEQPLYFPAFYWALVVGLLTTEWTLRRRFQLR
ncbi:MAG: glutamine amidotransferase [Isosphaeraceae bacterium]